MLGVAALIGALLTGLYAFRLVFIVFLGPESELVAHSNGEEHGHGEGPWTMTWPVGILTVLSIVGGGLQIGGVWHVFGDWLEPVAAPLVEPSTVEDYFASGIAVGLGLLGIGIAWFYYARRPAPALPRVPALRHALEHKLYFDELYDLVFYKPAVWTALALQRWVEEPLIGGSITGVTFGARRAAGAVRESQTGYLRSYALVIAGAAAVLVVVFLAVQ